MRLGGVMLATAWTGRALRSRLTIVRGDRERLLLTRRGRGDTVCARVAWLALLGGPSTSPLAVMESASVPSAQWRYLGGGGESRLRALTAVSQFSEIVGAIVRRLAVLCSHTERSGKSPTHKRQVYCAEIGPEAFDLFFNSQAGYRGAFYASPERGLAANALLLSAVCPQLIGWTRANCADQNPEFALKSLGAASAKVWLAEEGGDLCAQCKGQWSTSLRADVQIHNGRWELDQSELATWASGPTCSVEFDSWAHSSMGTAMSSFLCTNKAGRAIFVRGVGHDG